MPSPYGERFCYSLISLCIRENVTWDPTAGLEGTFKV